VLRALWAERPLLVAVDDLHSLDAATAEVPAFASPPGTAPALPVPAVPTIWTGQLGRGRALARHFLQRYLLTGRHCFFATSEAFRRVVTSMLNQHAKFLAGAAQTPWRSSISNLVYLLSNESAGSLPRRSLTPEPQITQRSDSQVRRGECARSSAESDVGPAPVGAQTDRSGSPSGGQLAGWPAVHKADQASAQSRIGRGRMIRTLVAHASDGSVEDGPKLFAQQEVEHLRAMTRG
jgi:D-xylulose 5-phosphate/D-fructose 6-phosphate phosphoketolase